MGFRQRAYAYDGKNISMHTPVKLAEGIESEAGFVVRAESGFVYSVIQASIPLSHSELAGVLVNDSTQADYIQTLLDDLNSRDQITREDDRYGLENRYGMFLGDIPTLQLLYTDIEQAEIPAEIERGAEAALALSKTAMVQRSQDFAAAAQSYLIACRLYRDALTSDYPQANPIELQWFMASYASVKAGALSQIEHRYVDARPYYLAFFTLVQEDNPLWSRMRGLINPMLSYYWANVGREFGLTVVASPSTNQPHHIAAMAATHEHPEVSQRWKEITLDLARVNANLLRRIVDQLRLNQNETIIYGQVADTIEEMLSRI
jgi:hypothetical protein